MGSAFNKLYRIEEQNFIDHSQDIQTEKPQTTLMKNNNRI